MGNPNVGKIGIPTQFKPGNPGGGNKKGNKHLSTWIQELLNDEEYQTQIREGLKIIDYKGAPLKAIVKTNIQLAINGDPKAAEWLAKYGYGTKLQLSNDPDNPINAPRELTDEELRARYQQIITKRETGTDSHSLGTGQTTSKD